MLKDRFTNSSESVWLPLVLAATPKIIAITGSGGKTSLMYDLAATLKRQGWTTVVSVTTKIFRPAGSEHRIVFPQSAQELASAGAVNETCLVTAAGGIDPSDQRKLTGLPPEWLGLASAKSPDTFFLLEADGAAGKPLKGYLPHEPVIPYAASLIISVVGLDVLGKPLDETHVHRASLVSLATGVPIGSPITVDIVVQMLLSETGYRKGCPANARTVFFLNKMESAAQSLAAEEIANEIQAARVSSVTGIVAGSMHTQKFCYWPMDN